MSLEEIVALPVASIAADHAHLFLWITGPMLVQSAHQLVMRAWGFQPSAIAFTWIKTKAHNQNEFHVGMGYTTRKNAEFCILGRRGNPKRLRKDVRELIISPRREHSRKPEELYHRVRQYCVGPYLDLFSREIRPAWESWGLERGKFNAVVQP